MRLSLPFWAFLLIFALHYRSVRTDGLDPSDSKVCEKVEQYPTEVKIKTTIPFVKRTYKWCPKFPFRCPTDETHYRESYRLETQMQNRTVFVCCSGYHQSANVCIPICANQCIHGQCIGPEICECQPGYGGATCNISCPEGKWGSQCEQTCKCSNNARCNPVDGSCSCLPGTWGPGCANVCTCQNGVCDSVTGTCACTPGFVGIRCDRACPDGNFGPQCASRCACQANQTSTCRHTDGLCICRSGYNGILCESSCPPGTYGQNCEQVCHCTSSAYVCDPVVGCVCRQPNQNEVDSCVDVLAESYRIVESAARKETLAFPAGWMFIFLALIMSSTFLLYRYKRKVKQLKMELYNVIYMRGGNGGDGSNDQFDNPLYAGNDGLHVQKLPPQMLSAANGQFPLGGGGYPSYCKNNLEKAKLFNPTIGGPSSIGLDVAMGTSSTSATLFRKQHQKSLEAKLAEFETIGDNNDQDSKSADRANPNIYTSIEEIKGVFTNKEPVYDEIAYKQDSDSLHKPMGTMIRQSKTMYDSDNSITESMNHAINNETKDIEIGQNHMAQQQAAPLHYDMPRKNSPRLIENPIDPFNHYETLSTASTYQADQKEAAFGSKLNP